VGANPGSNEPIVDALFKGGARIHKSGRIPVGIATTNVFNVAIIKLSGCNLDTGNGYPDPGNGECPDLSVLERLIDQFKKEAAVPRPGDDPATLAKWLSEKSGSLNTLLNAYKMGRNDAGLIVLKNGVDAGFVETRVMGWNAMWYATTCEHPCKKCVIQAAKYGVDVNHRELQSNRTVLFKYVFNYSQSCRDLDMVTLLAKTLDVNAKDADGLTAYDWTHIRHYSLTCWPTSPTPYNVSAQKILIAAGAVTRELSAPFACR
jgi:hypothetical protein